MNHRTTKPDSNEPEIEEKYLLTEGVTSTVLQHDFGEGRRSGIGHVALFDWDSHVTPEEAHEMARDGVIGGPVFIFESSPGNYHGWNLQVRRFSRTCAVLKRGEDDTGHREVGEGRGWWRLRVGNKRHADDREYRQAPTFVRTLMPAEGSNPRVSNPHLELARVCGVPQAHVEKVRRRCRTVGDSMEVVAYVTMTDVEKHVRRNVWSSEPLDGGA